MDKVQLVLEYLRKYHFWLLCVVAVVAGLAGWMMASGALSKEYESRKGTIEGKFSSLSQIQSNPSPPNVRWTEELIKLTDEERKEVSTAWQKVYAEQQQVLEWPEEILGSDFVQWIAARPPDAEIPVQWRTRYRDDVVNVEFPKLVERVDAKLELDDESGGTRSARNANDNAAGDEEPHQHTVVWSAESQQNVWGVLKMKDAGVPSSLEVRLRQEDLWVFRALLDIIRKTNETAKYISHIKRIEALSIGAEAAGRFQEGMKSGKIEMLQPVESAAAVAEQPTRRDANQEIPPDEDRYVDEAGTPLASGEAATQQFKRLPVYLELLMDQRQITTLLTECANYPLPLEVKQLRINPDYQAQAKRTKAPGGRSGAEDSAVPTASGPFDVTVQIHGIIYLYNPPDPNKLGQPADGSVAAGG